MQSLRRLKLGNIEVKDMALIMHESNGIILEYNSLDSFKANFNKYFLALNDFKDKIKAFYSLKSGAIFESNVYIMSTLEDKLDIPISTLFIDSHSEPEIKEITEFYYDDINDASFELNIVTCQKRNPLSIIEWILMSNLNGGVNLSIDMKTINPAWLNEKEIFDSIYPYINSFVYDEYIQVLK